VELTLQQAQDKASRKAQSQAYQDMGLEFNTRALCPPAEDIELQAILAREKEYQRDARVPADIRKQQAHLDKIEAQLEKLVYKTEITVEVITEIGLLTILWHHHLEKIEIGDRNPLAKELLDIYQKFVSH